jgi:acetyl/propionyl-CoA carboxylase alpha subunit
MADLALRCTRFHESSSEWLRSFAVDHVRCLVVCRGPVRKEAFEIFDAMGIAHYGMLLSEKDSIVYPRSLAPELRSLRDPARSVHRIPDYAGAGPEEKQARIRRILEIAHENGYTHVFAGYGFMAEDAEFIEAIERAGLVFVGPGSKIARRAGSKDEAKRLARSLKNAVVPGVDDVSERALLATAPTREALARIASERGLPFAGEGEPLEIAQRLIEASYAAGVELVTIEELQRTADALCRELWKENPGRRIRFKHVGGGGGKGQRIVTAPEAIPAAVMDVLAESKALAPGSNRNFLIELNIESTRHNEIQLIGNGSWCVSLGGRDCSVQMHEQKLVEVSLTKEGLEAEIATASGARRATLQGDLGTLERMEAEGERFGAACGLDSVSTFECAVEGFRHYFMEMNTRIQVEHGVTELAYRMRFDNPDRPGEHFYVDRLIEAMVLLAVHGPRLPRPVRVPRCRSSVEIRINATNAALQPHAGGLIRSWSAPLPGEIRFDQGIGTPNPDTGSFIYYNLAGAYDSNIALLLTDGESRGDNLARMAEILRRMEVRGEDLQTNLDVHYGLLQWMLGRAPMVKPSTRFMSSYLAGIGALATLAADVDVDLAFEKLSAGLRDAEARAALGRKQTLLLRPLRQLLASPHVLGGFLGRFDGELWQTHGGRVEFAENPLRFLSELYHFLYMEVSPGRPPCDVIWEHDAEILANATAFYARVRELTGIDGWKATAQLFEGSPNRKLAESEELWEACCAAHRAFQLGLELLLLIPRIGIASGFADIKVNEALEVVFPDKLVQEDSMRSLARALAPAPRASSNEIVTPSGGAFYSREAPHLPPLVQVGDHFKAGQPLFIIEVMKMFNKVLAPYSGRIVECVLAGQDGAIVRKGQVIFRIEPDERIEEETPAQIRERRSRVTSSLLS